MQVASIAIDGPAGAGKSTVAKQVAKRLQLMYIDTGAMYRAVTLKLMQKGIQLSNRNNVIKEMESIEISIKDERDVQRIFVNGQDVTKEIRTPRVTQNVSIVSQIPEVRLRLVELQRQLAKTQGVVMDGRDIGTFVLPDANVKVFLTASLHERAERRLQELQKQGYDTSLEEVEKDVAKRDQMDMNREFAPLRQAEDAFVIDTTGKTIDQVIEAILAVYESVMEMRGGHANR